MRTIVLAAVAALLGGAAYAQPDAPPPAWSGVWRGTLGGTQIRACFGEAGDANAGVYYYMSHLQLIRLDPDASPAHSWSEGENTDKTAPHWNVIASGANALSGTWTGKGKSLPISLTRMPLDKDDDADTACGAGVFTAPRIKTPTITRTPGVRDGVAYTTLTLQTGADLDVTVASFSLNATTPAATRLNAEFAKVLAKKDEGASDEYADCIAGATGSLGGDGEFSDVLKPNLIGKRWMVTEEDSEEFCGGAHPDEATNWSLYDLATGAAVDPWVWFNADGVTHSTDVPDTPQAGPKLAKMLAVRWTKKGECADVLDSVDGFWDPHPTPAGMAFWPELAHVVAACSRDVVIPYGELTPLLNAKGKTAIASIAEDMKTLPPSAKHK